MHTVWVPLFFVLGLCAGSLLTRVAYRLPREISLFNRPDFCLKCEQPLRYIEVIPVLSWVCLKKRCSRCAAPISARYPAIELATGILWAIEGWQASRLHYGTIDTIGVVCADLIFLSAMVVVVVVDWDFLIIPDEISLGGIVAGLFFSLLFPAMHGRYGESDFLSHWACLSISFYGMTGGIVAALVVYYAGKVLFKAKIKKAQEKDDEIDSVLGLGDVKLIGCFGAFFGLQALLPLVLIAVLSGSLAGIYLKLSSGDQNGATGLTGLKNRWHSGDSFFPFGPFLAFGAVVMLYLR